MQIWNSRDLKRAAALLFPKKSSGNPFKGSLWATSSPRLDTALLCAAKKRGVELNQLAGLCQTKLALAATDGSKKSLLRLATEKERTPMAEFLPINQSDMNRRGWTQCDFVYVVGDAYVDHPSFGHAIISRVLEAHGYKVGIISQPDWKNPDSISILGEPRLGFLVCGGNMDSMVNHYSVSRHHRKIDAYTPGGLMGKRPDYAVTVYCNLIRQRYKKAP